MIDPGLGPLAPLAVWHWNVDPVLFRIGPFALRWYSVLFLAGFLIGLRVMRGIYRREGKDERDLETLLLVTLAGTLIGARLGHCLFYDPAYYLAHPWEIPMVWRGGLASHGGLLGILAALAWYVRRREDRSYLWLLDRVAIPTALAGALIRLGNLFNSEIAGRPADVPWAVVLERIDSVARHPVQLYEAAAYLAVFVALLALYRRLGAGAPRGLLLGTFLVLVFSARFALEPFKSHQAAFGADWPLSVGQLLSIPAVLAGVALVVRALRGGGR